MTVGTDQREAAEAATPAGQDADPRLTGLRLLGRAVGSIVAPTTLLTSLLYYFGWSYSFTFYGNFGISYTVLGLGTTDYLITSVDGLFMPLANATGAGLLALWGHAAFGARLGAVRYLVPGVAGVGAVLAGGGFLSLYVPALDRYVAIAPLSLGIGVLLIAYANHLRRTSGQRLSPGPEWSGIAEWVVVFVLVGMSLFWAVGEYSIAVANSRAQHFVDALPTAPAVILYSEKGLNLRVPGVREARCRAPRSAYAYRYDGLKLLRRSGDQYLFLPQGWTRENGVAVLIPRNDAMRLEFAPATHRTAAAAAAC